MRHAPLALPIALLLAACSANPDTPAPDTPAESTVDPAPAPAPAPAATAPAAPAATRTIGLEGLGDLRLGQPVPPGGSWAERGAQTGDACRTVTSPDFPGVYAIVTGGKVRRITVGKRSDVTLVEGIGVGAPEAEVRAAFGGFAETPHKYEDAPAKYLTAPNAASGDPALRFEIGQDGKVSLIHIGTEPELGYVEGCS